MAQYGNGATITFDSGFFGEPISVQISGISRPVIETTHLGTVGAKTFIPGKNYDPGSLEVEFAFETNESPAILATTTSETVTLTVPGTGTATASWAASGFMSDFSWGVPMDDRMTGNATIKITGSWTVTTAA